jgi:hypothetical protein
MGLNIIKLLHPRQFRSATMKLKLGCIVVLLQLPTWLLPCHAEDERDMRYWKFSEEGYVPEISDRLKRRKHWGFINRAGEFVIAPQYESALDFYEGLAAVKMDGKWGFINTAGKMEIPPRYWRCGSFKDGRALIVIPGNARPPSTNANWLNQEVDFGKFWQLDQRGPNAWGWEGHH